MSLPRGGRRGRRLVGVLLGVTTIMSLVGLAPASYADDDYPYRGLGQCPLVPLPHHPGTKPGGKPGTKPGAPTKPGDGHGAPTKPGPGHSPHGPAQKPPKTPPPPRVCARNIWLYNGTYGDPWGFALRNCTSFVAWRLRETNGDSGFTNDMAGVSWGDARNWDETARALGYLVDDVPAVGAVAQTDHGAKGHVAWVSAVGDGTVTVEEYNYYVPGGYDERTVPTSDFRYLHIDDISPAPTLGSTRAAAVAVDRLAQSWTARTDGRGDLTVRGPSGRDLHLGAAGSWSPNAAPSLVADPQGRMWVAAVTRTGGLFTAHTDASSTPRWSRLRPVGQGDWSTTSTPTLAVDAQGRLRLLAVTASGSLVERHTSSAHPDRWSRPDLMGLAGSWSTQAAPAVTADPAGRLWVVAVTRRGTLQERHTEAGGTRWTRFHAVDHRTWSLTSTPALTAADGRMWLAAVTARGTLVSRLTGVRTDGWGRGSQVPGVWSPYASPSSAVEASGRLWLAATLTSGEVAVRSTTPGSSRWRTTAAPSHAARAETTSPVLVPAPVGNVQLATPGGSGRLLWRSIGDAAADRALLGPRAGGFAASFQLQG